MSISFLVSGGGAAGKPLPGALWREHGRILWNVSSRSPQDVLTTLKRVDKVEVKV